ncbi:hypothetical protein [Pseudomonas sp. NPDC085632]|uniref:hypothetical protein n=1 Tax=Pseudomonas sp. NPDC085632 TaxID=3364429 RepID=UPI0037C795B1
MPPKKQHKHPTEQCGSKKIVATVAPCSAPLYCFRDADEMERARKFGIFHKRMKDWIVQELDELMQTIDNATTNIEAIRLLASVENAVTDDAIHAIAKTTHAFIQTEHLQMFTLDANRVCVRSDYPCAEYWARKYGYHLTKADNLAGIAQAGLSPKAGASDRGSVAMSTASQLNGSIQTSTNVIAYGLCPGVFRTYINQFADRRQMISGAPAGLRPVMLRFRMSEEVVEKSDYDFMDGKALNTTASIPPADIEVLTDNGWLRIDKFCAHENMTPELRQEETRPALAWKEPTAIFTYEQMEDAGINIFDNPIHLATYISDVRHLTRLIGVYNKNSADLKYTFRGATLQTSGHRKEWEYAFSYQPINGKATSKPWLDSRTLAYQTRFFAPAQPKATQEFERPSAKVPSIDKVQRETLEGFDEGTASGEGNNCLLSTLYQLFHNTRVENEQAVATMRQGLVSVGHAADGNMIDIYGGAGQQLANDLGLRIRVIQKLDNGQLISHPLLGQQGRIVWISHNQNHFTPLWPKEIHEIVSPGSGDQKEAQ